LEAKGKEEEERGEVGRRRGRMIHDHLLA